MRRYRNYTDEDIIQAVSTSETLAETLRKLNLQPVGGNYDTLKRNILRLDIDISHMRGQAWSKNLALKDLDEYKSVTGIKNKLISKRGYQCEGCGLATWQGEEIPLELHHIDGNRLNNEDKNLRLYCPNCHSLTENWRRQKE